jgi:hypothetical protein
MKKYFHKKYKMIRKPTIGDKIKVKTKRKNILCIIDSIDTKYTHFKNDNGFGLTVNTNRIHSIMVQWYGAYFEYVSIN